MRFRFIHAEKANHCVRSLCRVLGVSTSGYYAWVKRGPSQHSKRDQLLRTKVRACFEASRGTYGSPRIRAELRDHGFRVGRTRIARLMREQGIFAAKRKRFRKTTDSNHSFGVAGNELDRGFNVSQPNRVWAADITYVRTWEGWLYLAVVVDLFSRRVVGWSAAPHMRTELVTGALRMALGQRVPQGSLLHHSDRGSQYASTDYRQLLQDNDVRCSMSRTADCWDNAVVESFFATLKKELVHRSTWATRQRAKNAISEYIQTFYNPHRRHSTLGFLSPAEFERRHHNSIIQQAA